VSLCIAATAGLVRDMEPDVKAMKRWAGAGYATATDLADWLVRVPGLPFREAHHVTGRLVAMAAERKSGLEKLTLADMQSVDGRITDDVFAVLGVEKSVRSRTSYGGTAPANVRKQAKRWLARLKKGGSR
jgi:argininosuccinate lyase